MANYAGLVPSELGADMVHDDQKRLDVGRAAIEAHVAKTMVITWQLHDREKVLAVPIIRKGCREVAHQLVAQRRETMDTITVIQTLQRSR